MTGGRDLDQLELWAALCADGAMPASLPRPPRRFRAVSAERERELVDEGRRMNRAEAERILARLGR